MWFKTSDFEGGAGKTAGQWVWPRLVARSQAPSLTGEGESFQAYLVCLVLCQTLGCHVPVCPPGESGLSDSETTDFF